MKKIIFNIFIFLVFVSLLTPFWSFRDLLFPYITSKAFFFRIVIEAALPFYLYLVFSDPVFRPKLKNPLNLAVVAFLLVNVASAILGVNPERSLLGYFERMGGVYYLAHLTVFVFYVQLVGQAGQEYLKRFIQFFIGVSVLITLNGLSSWFGGPSIVLDTSAPTRISSTFGNPIFFASFLIIPLSLAVYFALREEVRSLKIMYSFAAFLILLGIYTSGTRGAFVGLVVALIAAVIIYGFLIGKPGLRNRSLGFIVILFIVAAGLFVFRAKLPQDSVFYRLTNLGDSNSKARLIQWSTALKGFNDRKLLGVGPENYYFISNTYWDTEMYKYDSSWFDKPHNFLVEVLATTGLFGFVSYSAIFILSIYAFYRAYKNGLLSLIEMCVLVSGVIAYQGQNFFVFDTVSASMTIYAFLGIAVFMWAGNSENKGAENSRPIFSPPIAAGVFVVMCLAMAYMQYASNFSSMIAAKRINYGQAYAEQDPLKAKQNFLSALSQPYNLGRRETANYYSRFASGLVNNNTNVDKAFISEELDRAIANQQIVSSQVKNDPILWMTLAIAEMNRSVFHGQGIEGSKETIEKAIALAPNRAEILQLQIQYFGYLKDWENLSRAAEKIAELNPYNPQLRWQVAMAYFLNGKIKEAVKAGDEAIAAGFKFSQLQQFAWYIQYYQEKKDFEKVIPLLEKAVEIEPNELGLYVDLAKAYAAIGDFEHASLLAQQVEKSDPSRKEEMEKFIKSLK